jgi:HAMP domain-containing protein
MSPIGRLIPLRSRKIFAVFGSGRSLRVRVAYSLAIVRLILAPVILLAIYYLFLMGWIVDRIVNVDAPAATLSQQSSIQMLEARRAERNYFLLRDPAYVKANQDSLAKVTDILTKIDRLEPEEHATTQKALEAMYVYQQQFSAAVGAMTEPGKAPRERVRAVVSNYEKDLNSLVQKDRRESRAKLVDELRSQVGSFDTEITNTIQTGDPVFRQHAGDIENASENVFNFTSRLEGRIWQRVQNDHLDARKLLRRAEWVLSMVSVVVILLSVWISFVLPKAVVEPLISLKNAVDAAASGKYNVEFDLKGKDEVVDLAKSVHNLILHIASVHQTA